jgi:hypothetical protein
MGDMKDFIEYIDIGDNYKTPKRTRLYCDHKDCNVYIKGTEGYIEACSPIQNFQNKQLKYGEWGVSAIEAAALGKIVITHFLSHKKYEQVYGQHELCVANTPSDIAVHLESLLELSDDELLKRRKATRSWVEKFHSFKAVGTRLKEEIYEI